MQQSILVISTLSSSTQIGLGRMTRIITEMGHLPHLVLTGVDTSKTKTPEPGALTLLPADLVETQLERNLVARINNAVVVGAIGSAETQKRLAARLEEHKKKRLIPIVVNPCLPIDEGDPAAMSQAAQDFLTDLCPLANVVTPSVREAELLADMAIETPEDMLAAGEKLVKRGCKAVFLHGGNFEDGQTTYMLVTSNSNLTFTAPLILRKKNNDRRLGFGGALAAAIAVCLAKGQNFQDSIERALVQMKRLALSEL